MLMPVLKLTAVRSGEREFFPLSTRGGIIYLGEVENRLLTVGECRGRNIPDKNGPGGLRYSLFSDSQRHSPCTSREAGGRAEDKEKARSNEQQGCVRSGSGTRDLHRRLQWPIGLSVGYVKISHRRQHQWAGNLESLLIDSAHKVCSIYASAKEHRIIMNNTSLQGLQVSNKCLLVKSQHLAPSSQKRHCAMIHLITHSLDNLYTILKNTNNLKEIFLTDTFLFQMSGPKQFDHLLTESIWILNLSTAHTSLSG